MRQLIEYSLARKRCQISRNWLPGRNEYVFVRKNGNKSKRKAEQIEQTAQDIEVVPNTVKIPNQLAFEFFLFIIE
jgi:hypothetical protein